MEDYMKKYNIIKRGIEQNDVRLLREAVGNACLVDRDFSKGEFNNLVLFVQEKGIKLKENNLVGELISKGKTSYTDEDFASAVFELKENFCDERIADVKKIGRALYSKKEQDVFDKKANMSQVNPVQKEGFSTKKSQSHQKKEGEMPVWQKLLVAVPNWGWILFAIVLLVLIIIFAKGRMEG